MGITYGDHLTDSGYYDISPEQERALDQQADQQRELDAREECERRGIDPDQLCADGGVEAWMVVAKETARRNRESGLCIDCPPVGCSVDRYRCMPCSRRGLEAKHCRCANSITSAPCIVCGKPKFITRDWFEGKAKDEGDLEVGAGVENRTSIPLADELDPEVGFPSDDLLRRIHLDVETRGRKNPAFAVSVHHRNIVLSAVAHALRKRGFTWEEWLEACGWPRGSGACECYRPGDCDGSCTHPVENGGA